MSRQFFEIVDAVETRPDVVGQLFCGVGALLEIFLKQNQVRCIQCPRVADAIN